MKPEMIFAIIVAVLAAVGGLLFALAVSWRWLILYW